MSIDFVCASRFTTYMRFIHALAYFSLKGHKFRILTKLPCNGKNCSDVHARDHTEDDGVEDEEEPLEPRGDQDPVPHDRRGDVGGGQRVGREGGAAVLGVAVLGLVALGHVVELKDESLVG